MSNVSNFVEKLANIDDKEFTKRINTGSTRAVCGNLYKGFVKIGKSTEKELAIALVNLCRDKKSFSRANVEATIMASRRI